jgi:hypothetical protein
VVVTIGALEPSPVCVAMLAAGLAGLLPPTMIWRLRIGIDLGGDALVAADVDGPAPRGEFRQHLLRRGLCAFTLSLPTRRDRLARSCF